jgi:regulatory protein YycH of two-component signal transduction system YycFG
MAHVSRVAESRAEALEQTVSICEASNPDLAQHARNEAELLERVNELSAKLQRYQLLYGDTSAQSPDLADLMRRLEDRDRELEALRLVDSQHEQVRCFTSSQTAKM